MIGMTLGWIMSIAILVTFLWLLAGGLRPPQFTESPEDILRRRYAEGGIDAKEYEARLEKLRSGSTAA